MDLLERAIEIATAAHAGQTDKFGRPYITHPERVMKMGGSEEEKIVGILHDVVEDTDRTFADLQREGFPAEIISALVSLTRDKKNETYEHYISRVATNPLAVAVKLNDLTDNMDLRRYPQLTDEDIRRLKKYHCAYMHLKAL